MTNSSEMVFEKTPRYVADIGIIDRMKDTLPNIKTIKFIEIICDPIKRAFSDFIHAQKYKEFDIFKGQDYKFSELVKDGVKLIDTKLNELSRYELMKWLKGFYERAEDSHLSILTNGLYKYNLRVYADTWKE